MRPGSPRLEPAARCGRPARFGKQAARLAPELVAGHGDTLGGPITQVERTWDGAYYESSICGLGVGCISQNFAPPGHYVAPMCATPGMIVEGDAGQSSCTATGPQECIDVPFDFPGQSPIEATRP